MVCALMKQVPRTLVLLGLLLTGMLAAGEQHAFYAGRIWPGDGEPIDDGVMVVEDGRIVAVGPRKITMVPASARRHDLGDAVIIPGLVVAETSLGVSADDDRTLTPEVRAVDGFDFYEDYLKYVAGGVTTVQVAPGRARLMPGQGGVVKLAGTSPAERILSDRESLRLILTDASANAPRIYEPPVGAVSLENPLKPTRPQISGSLAARVAGLDAVFGVAARQGDGGAGGDELGLDSIARYLKDQGRLRVTAGTAAEIRAALGLARRHGVKLVLVDPSAIDELVSDAHADRRELVAGVILNAGLRPGQITDPAVPDPEQKRPRDAWDNAARLVAAGFGDRLAIRPSADTDLDDMLFLGGLFLRGGLNSMDGLRMLTSNPARMMAVDDRVGALSPGHDADFVVLSDDPFRRGSAVLETWVNGRSVYNRERENRMMVVEAAAIYTGDGRRLDNAAVVVGGRTIRGLGQDVSAPPDARLKRFRSGHIVPGYIDLATGLGLGGPISSLSLSTRVGERLVADDPAVEFAREGGVTTAVLATSGSPSSMLAFKLGETPRVLREPVGIRFSMPSNLTSGLPALKSTLGRGKAYADAWTKYEKDLAAWQQAMKEYQAALAKYEAQKKAEAAKKAADAKKQAEQGEKSGADSRQKPEESGKAIATAAAAQTPAPDKKETEDAGKPATDKKPAGADKPNTDSKGSAANPVEDKAELEKRSRRPIALRTTKPHL